MSRRARLRRWLRTALSIAAALAAIDAFLVEPYALEVTRHARAAKVKTRLRIAHVTDLHTGGIGVRERRLLAALERERPDLVAITGDTVDHGDLSRATPVLAAMKAPLGVFAVLGNWEHWRPVADADATLRGAGVQLLRNQWVRVRDDLVIVGLDDHTAGESDPARAFAGAPSGVATVALFHSPVAYESVRDRVDLALAGHTHGGQVRAPFFGPLWLPPGSGRYVQGWYDRLYVSRGVGTSILRVRFLCRPELAILDLAP